MQMNSFQWENNPPYPVGKKKKHLFLSPFANSSQYVWFLNAPVLWTLFWTGCNTTIVSSLKELNKIFNMSLSLYLYKNHFLFPIFFNSSKEKVLNGQSQKISLSSSSSMCFTEEETEAQGVGRTCLRTWEGVGVAEPGIEHDTGFIVPHTWFLPQLAPNKCVAPARYLPQRASLSRSVYLLHITHTCWVALRVNEILHVKK